MKKKSINKILISSSISESKSVNWCCEVGWGPEYGVLRITQGGKDCWCSCWGVLRVAAVVYHCVKVIRERENQTKVEKFLEDYRGLKPTRFRYSYIRRITNEFSEKVGEEGGYGWCTRVGYSKS